MRKLYHLKLGMKDPGRRGSVSDRTFAARQRVSGCEMVAPAFVPPITPSYVSTIPARQATIGPKAVRGIIPIQIDHQDGLKGAN